MKTGLKTTRDTDLPVNNSIYSKAILARNGSYELGSIGYYGALAPGTDYISKTQSVSQSVAHDFTVNGDFAAKHSASIGSRIYTAYDPANSIDYGVSSNSSLYFGTQDPLSKSHTVGDYRLKSTGSSWVVERCTVGGNWGEGTWIKDCGCGGEVQGDQNIPELILEPIPDPDEFVNIMKYREEPGEWDCIEAVLNVIRLIQAAYDNSYKMWKTIMYCIENNIAVIHVMGSTAIQLIQVPACYCNRYSMYNAYIDANGKPYHVYHDNGIYRSEDYRTVAEMITMYNNSYMDGYNESNPNVILDVNNFPCLSLPENQYLIDRYNAIRNQFLSFSDIII